MTIITDGYFNVMDYGAKGNPYGDDTVAIKAAAHAARATASKWGSKGLFFPPGERMLRSVSAAFSRLLPGALLLIATTIALQSPGLRSAAAVSRQRARAWPRASFASRARPARE